MIDVTQHIRNSSPSVKQFALVDDYWINTMHQPVVSGQQTNELHVSFMDGCKVCVNQCVVLGAVGTL